MEVRLTVTHKKANTRQVRLGADTTIGRAPECQLRIASTEVSRRHCRIRISDRTISVCDLGSANGTFLNGQQIPPSLNVQMVDGDTLQVGPLKFVVECGAIPPMPAGGDDADDLSDTADDFENVRVVSAEGDSGGGSGDYVVRDHLPDSGSRLPASIPLADDDDSGSIPGGATISDRELPPLDRKSGNGGRPAKPAAQAPLSGERPARSASSGAVPARKTPSSGSVPRKPPSSDSAIAIPLSKSNAGDESPPGGLMDRLGLLGKNKSSGELPTPPKRKQPTPPSVKSDDLDLTLRTDDDDHGGSDATIHLPEGPGKKRPSPGKKTVSHFVEDETPRKPARKPAGKSPPARSSDSSIAESTDEDDQALADFLKGFDK